MQEDLGSGVWVLLHQVEGPINLGSVCRAMANTGFEALAITGSLKGDEPEARKFAIHAQELLQSLTHYRDIAAMTRGFDLVFGFSPRQPWQDGRNLEMDRFLQVFAQAQEKCQKIGLLFGNEASGLTNEDLGYCGYRVNLPSHEDYRSLNLAQAVMVVLWELRRHLVWDVQAKPQEEDGEVSTPQDRAILVKNIRQFLDTFNILDPQNPDRLWREFQLMFTGRSWRDRELQLLHVLFNKARVRYEAALKRKIGS